MKTKEIKAWAVVRSRGRIEYESNFTYGDCCCASEPQSLAIYHKKKLAIANIKYDMGSYKVVPVSIKILKK